MEKFEDTPRYDVAIIGGGIGGLSAAKVLSDEHPDASIILCEKEDTVGQGTSRGDHNTNTAHTGAFYPVNSLKAVSARKGFRFLRDYHDQKGLVRRDIGKIIAASEEGDGPLIEKYYRQAVANGQRPESVSIISGDELRSEHEPLLGKNVESGLLLRDCFLFDADGVMRELAKDLERSGVTVGTDLEVLEVTALPEGWLVKTSRGEFIAKHLVNQAGTHADRIAKMTGGAQDWKIIPVMGSYFELDEPADFRHAIYEPTRRPPFLGVHIMPGQNGKPFMGPDVFFSPYRERIGEETKKRRLKDWILEPFGNLIGFSETGKNAFPNADFYLGMLGSAEGRAEVRKHFHRREFSQDVQRLVNPDLLTIDPGRIHYLRSGIRAQALDLVEGKILQDMDREILLNPHNLDSLAIHDKMPGSPGFTASVGKAAWLVGEIREKLAGR